MWFNRRWMIAGVAAVALAGAVTGTALALSSPRSPVAAGSGQVDAGEDEAGGQDVPIRDEGVLAEASAAALAYLAEQGLQGRVTDTEVGDEQSYYEVEVTLDDGRQIDVQLDEQFAVVGDETDGAGEDD